jgi:hypothetical protein
MTDLHVFALSLLAIVAIGSTAVAIYDELERRLASAREQRIRADVTRGPWSPR